MVVEGVGPQQHVAPAARLVAETKAQIDGFADMVHDLRAMLRWLDGRADSPWYPSMRLFRQPAWGDWPAVFERIREAAAERSASF